MVYQKIPEELFNFAPRNPYSWPFRKREIVGKSFWNRGHTAEEAEFQRNLNRAGLSAINGSHGDEVDSFFVRLTDSIPPTLSAD